MGLVQRVKNCRSRNVGSGWSLNFEIGKTDLVSITDELLGNLNKFLEFVGHVDWVGAVVGGRERCWLGYEACGRKLSTCYPGPRDDLSLPSSTSGFVNCSSQKEVRAFSARIWERMPTDDIAAFRMNVHLVCSNETQTKCQT